MKDDGMNISEKLDRLADMQAQGDVMNAHFDSLRDQILTPEIKAQLDEIEAERKTAMDALNEGIASLTEEIKADVMQAGATIRGKYLIAVWNKGRVSWDTKALDGFSSSHPEILAFRKEGDPSISIRGMKGV
jgi:hypothetical protein